MKTAPVSFDLGNLCLFSLSVLLEICLLVFYLFKELVLFHCFSPIFLFLISLISALTFVISFLLLLWVYFALPFLGPLGRSFNYCYVMRHFLFPNGGSTNFSQHFFHCISQILTCCHSM